MHEYIDNPGFIKGYSPQTPGKLIGKISIEPQEQSRLPLGIFKEPEHLKGFSVEFEPEPFPNGSVVAQITSMAERRGLALTMHIANYSSTPVAVIVRQIE